MNNHYLSVHFKTTQEKGDIITAILMDAGFEALEQKEDETVISIRKELLDESWFHEFMLAQDVDYRTETVEQQNWNAAWEKSFEPVAVNDFAIIRASFHESVAGFQHEIIITPKMSFGTGHHATTHLMIEQMAAIDFRKKKVIDFGTGTGVLAILAEKLGASEILAIDHDEWSIHNSMENIEANHCKKISTSLANEMTSNEKADIVLANINLNVIIDNLNAIRESILPGGMALFSGLLKQDLEQISATLKKNHFSIKNVKERNGWICLLTTHEDYPQT